MTKRIATLIFIFALCSFLSACASKKKDPSNFSLDTEIIASNDINLDNEGSASPVSFIIYQLSDNESFIAADYNSLVLEPQSPFSDAIVSKKQYQIQPGKRAVVTIDVSPETRYIGVAGAFREAKTSRNKNWASIIDLPKKIAKKKSKLQSKIFLSGNKIDVVIVKSGRLSFN